MKRTLALAIRTSALCVLALALFPFILRSGHLAAQRDSRHALEEGYVTTPDGVRLYYVKAGRGARTVILPARLFTFDDFRWLAEDYTLISYDMRNRGRSETVADGSLITFEADVEDLETIRRHFQVEKFSAIGYSYLGKLIVIYAMQHPERIERLIQIGPVPLTFDTAYPEHLAAQHDVPDELRKPLRDMRARNYHLTHPREYCEEEWKVFRSGLVGDPANVAKLGPSQCDMPNEWPMNLVRHMRLHFQESAQKHTVPREQIAQVKAPVLTIHGTLDRNAPYGAGREWCLLLPNARLLTVKNAAHQVFAEYPKIVRSAVRTFLAGSWPAAAKKITVLDPGAAASATPQRN